MQVANTFGLKGVLCLRYFSIGGNKSMVDYKIYIFKVVILNNVFRELRDKLDLLQGISHEYFTDPDKKFIARLEYVLNNVSYNEFLSKLNENELNLFYNNVEEFVIEFSRRTPMKTEKLIVDGIIEIKNSIWLDVHEDSNFELSQLGFIDGIAQQFFGYADSYDVLAGAVFGFDIYGTKFKMDIGVTLRLWRGNYDVKQIEGTLPGGGAEMGFYYPDSILSWGACMTPGSVKEFGITKTKVEVFMQGETNPVLFREQNDSRYWTSVFDHRRAMSKNNIVAVYTITFDNEEFRNRFYKSLKDALPAAKKYFHTDKTAESIIISKEGQKAVSIIYGNK